MNNIEVCVNGCQLNGCEVATSDLFPTMSAASAFADNRIGEIEYSGDWIWADVTIYGADGHIASSLAANC